MKAYLAILSSRFLALLQYRAAAVAGVCTQLFFGLVRVMIFDGFYRSSSGPQPMTYDQVVTYIWLGQAMLALTLLAVDNDVAESPDVRLKRSHRQLREFELSAGNRRDHPLALSAQWRARNQAQSRQNRGCPFPHGRRYLRTGRKTSGCVSLPPISMTTG